MTEEEKKESGEITRREFIKDAGFVVGGAVIGAGITYPLVPREAVETIEVEVPGPTVTVEVPGPTVTVEVPGPTVTVSKFICPIDNQEFNTLAELKAHFAAAHPEEEAIPGLITLNVNGENYPVQVKPYSSLLNVLREKLGLPGTKDGCNMGECGTCTVLMNGKPVYACMVLAIEADGASIETVEGLSDGITLSPVQQKIYDNDAMQCGYCAPGLIMAATALMREKASPTLDEVREALSGHQCTCGNINVFMAALLGLRIGG